MSKRYAFPANFLFGAATASYQIEGAAKADGKGVSVWDTFAGTPGKIIDHSNGNDACKHYEYWEQDLDLIKSLNLDTYRFSIAWPRIIPNGSGSVNPKGLDFYERLVDGLLKRGIKPNATLYHWDLPQVLEDKDGWMNRDTAKAFADYAAVVVKKLGDRVDFWATFNEPQVFVGCGYEIGVHAPGRKEPKKKYIATHNVLLGHGLGMQAIRANASKAGYQAGIALAPVPVWPQTQDPKDLEASERHWEDTNDWWMHPMLLGHYPEAVWKRRGDLAPQVLPGDLETIHQPMDFLGLNYYSPARTQHSKTGGLWEGAEAPQGAPRQAMERWEIFAPGLEHLIVQFSKRYPKIPLYVTENGMSQPLDVVDEEDGKIHDPQRIRFIRAHLAACHSAISQGADLRGYYVWSLMDNFEWGYGYTQRFGITHVDYGTYKRTVKDSGKWYAEAALAKGFETP